MSSKPAQERKRLRRQQRLAEKPWLLSKRSLKLAERDGWICHLCGEPVPPAPWSWADPLRPTLDHLRPKSRGGTRAAYNLALAHAACNRRRGNRALSRAVDPNRPAV